MNRKELMKMIALATGVSVAGGHPSGAADLHPELEGPPFVGAGGQEDVGGFEDAGGREGGGFGGY